MNKDKVYESYEEITEWYDDCRSRDLFEKPYLDFINNYIPKNATILDIGCGMGEPISQYVIEQGIS